MAYKVDAIVPSEYEKIKAELEGDKNFCAVAAVAAITKEPAKKIQSMMSKHGRKIGRSTERAITRKVLNELGFKIKVLSFAERSKIILSYPEPHNKLHGITTHHPRRFPAAWTGKPDMLMFSKAHVSAYVDGVVCDWAIKSSKRVTEIWTIEKA